MNKRIWIIILVGVLVMLGAYAIIARSISKSLRELHEMEVQFLDEAEVKSKLEFESLPEELYNSAQLLDDRSSALVEHIEESKSMLLDVAQSDTDYLRTTEQDEFIFGMKKHIDSHAVYLTNVFPGYATDLVNDLYTSDQILNGESIPWEEFYFDHCPLAATITVLTKHQSDVRNIESVILDSLKVKMDLEILKTTE